MSTAAGLRNRKIPTWIENITYAQLPKIKSIAFIRDEIAFELDDNRIIYTPLSWSKKLKKATDKQKLNYTSNGYHIFWDDIDEIIGIKNVLFGKELYL